MNAMLSRRTNDSLIPFDSALLVPSLSLSSCSSVSCISLCSSLSPACFENFTGDELKVPVSEITSSIERFCFNISAKLAPS